MTFTNFIKNQAPPTSRVINDFEKWLSYNDESKLSEKDKNEIINALNENEWIRILCACCYEEGYNSF